MPETKCPSLSAFDYARSSTDVKADIVGVTIVVVVVVVVLIVATFSGIHYLI